MLDYPRSASNEVQTIKEFDKLFDGTVLISSSMSESNVRKEIADALHRKDSSIYNFSLIQDKDFEFIKCVDKKVRLLDGENVYDAQLLKKLYSGEIYVRLKCPYRFIQKGCCFKNADCYSGHIWFLKHIPALT